jgi:hypothetical protein
MCTPEETRRCLGDARKRRHFNKVAFSIPRPQAAMVSPERARRVLLQSPRNRSAATPSPSHIFTSASLGPLVSSTSASASFKLLYPNFYFSGSHRRLPSLRLRLEASLASSASSFSTSASRRCFLDLHLCRSSRTSISTSISLRKCESTRRQLCSTRKARLGDMPPTELVSINAELAPFSCFPKTKDRNNHRNAIHKQISQPCFRRP